MGLIQLGNVSVIDGSLAQNPVVQRVVLIISHERSTRWDEGGLDLGTRSRTAGPALENERIHLLFSITAEHQNQTVQEPRITEPVEALPKGFKVVAKARKFRSLKRSQQFSAYTSVLKRIGTPLQSKRDSNIELTDLCNAMVLLVSKLLVNKKVWRKSSHRSHGAEKGDMDRG